MLTDPAPFSSSSSSLTSPSTPLFATVSFWTTDPSVVTLLSSSSHSSNSLDDLLLLSEEGKSANGPLAIFRVPVAPQTTLKQLAKEGVHRLVYSRRHTRTGSQSAAFAATFSHLKVIGAHVSGGSQPPAEVFSHDFVNQVVVLGEERVHFKLAYSSPVFSTSADSHMKALAISSLPLSEASCTSREWKASSIRSPSSLNTTHQHQHEDSSGKVVTRGESGWTEGEARSGKQDFSSHQVSVPPLQEFSRYFRDDHSERSVECEVFEPTVLPSDEGDKGSKKCGQSSTSTKEAPYTSFSPDGSFAAVAGCSRRCLSDPVPREKEEGISTTPQGNSISSFPSYSSSKPREECTSPRCFISRPTVKRTCGDGMEPKVHCVKISTKDKTQGDNEKGSGAMNATREATNADSDRCRESSCASAMVSNKRTLGWGPRAHEMFPENYVSSPDKLMRRKKKEAKLEVLSYPSKIEVELKKGEKTVPNRSQEGSPGGFITVPDVFVERAFECQVATSDGFCSTQPLITAPLGMLRELQKATALLSTSAATIEVCDASEVPGQSADGVRTTSRKVGWGPEAYKNFPSNYEDSPDRYARELRLKKRQRQEEEKKKKERFNQEPTAVRVS